MLARLAALTLAAAACTSSPQLAPDAGPLTAACLELSNLKSLNDPSAQCKSGDTIVVGDEVEVGPNTTLPASYSCEGVPCAIGNYISPLDVGTLTIHVAVPSYYGPTDEVTLPPLNVRTLDRIDFTCAGCATAKVGDSFTVSAHPILDGNPRSLQFNRADMTSMGPSGPAQVASTADGYMWTWIDVQPGTYVIVVHAGGLWAVSQTTVTP